MADSGETKAESRSDQHSPGGQQGDVTTTTQQPAQASDDAPLVLPKVVLGPPDFVKKMDSFMNQVRRDVGG